MSTLDNAHMHGFAHDDDDSANTAGNPVRAWCYEVAVLARLAWFSHGRVMYSVVIRRAAEPPAKAFVDVAADLASIWLVKGVDPPTFNRDRLHGLVLVHPSDVPALVARWATLVAFAADVTLKPMWDANAAEHNRSILMRAQLGALLRFVCAGSYRGRASCGDLAVAWDRFAAAGGPEGIASRTAPLVRLAPRSPQHQTAEQCTPTANRRSG